MEIIKRPQNCCYFVRAHLREKVEELIEVDILGIVWGKLLIRTDLRINFLRKLRKFVQFFLRIAEWGKYQSNIKNWNIDNIQTGSI